MPIRDYLKYDWIVIKEAAGRTITYLRPSWKAGAFICVLAVMVEFLMFGLESASGEVRWLISFGVAMVLYAIFVFAWNISTTPFRLWKLDQKRITDLTEKLAPKLDLKFSTADKEYIHTTTLSNGINEIQAKFFRICVSYLGYGSIVCTGHVTDIIKDKVQLNAVGNVKVTFSPGWADDALEKRIHSGVPEYLDIGFIDENGNFGLAVKDFKPPASIKNIFRDEGNYILTIVVTSQESASETISLLLHHTKDMWTTSVRPWQPENISA